MARLGRLVWWATLPAAVVAVAGLAESGFAPLADAAGVAPRVVPTVSSPQLESARFTGPAPQAYPYPAPSRGARLDPYGFVAGQCTSFVAWWLNTHGLPFGVLTRGPGGIGTFLNASGWDSSARAAGYQVGDRPVVGAIAQWHSHETSLRREATGELVTLAAGEPGHVAVVTAVMPDGQAQWVEYGWGDRPGLHIGYGRAPRYLYVGVRPPT